MHKFKVGDLVVYTNDFGVCWGVVKITELAEGFSEADGPRYHYEGSETPWYPVSEKNLTLADKQDRFAAAYDAHLSFFQGKYGFTPTVEQLGGCY